MPIYSFQCNDCDHQFDKFFFRVGQKETPPCPKCKSDNTAKKIGVTNTRVCEKGSSTTQCLPKFGLG